MKESRKATAYCGLYCGDCIPGNKELFKTAERLQEIIEETETIFLKHNKRKQKLKLLNPFKLFLEIKEYYKNPRELWARVKYVLNIK